MIRVILNYSSALYEWTLMNKYLYISTVHTIKKGANVSKIVAVLNSDISVSSNNDKKWVCYNRFLSLHGLKTSLSNIQMSLDSFGQPVLRFNDFIRKVVSIDIISLYSKILICSEPNIETSQDESGPRMKDRISWSSTQFWQHCILCM